VNHLLNCNDLDLATCTVYDVSGGMLDCVSFR